MRDSLACPVTNVSPAMYGDEIEVRGWEAKGPGAAAPCVAAQGMHLLRCSSPQAEVRVEEMGGNRRAALGVTSLLVVRAERPITVQCLGAGDWQMVSLPVRLVEECLALEGWPEQLGGEFAVVLQVPAMHQLLDQLSREKMSPALGSGLAVEALARLLLLELARQTRSEEKPEAWVALPPRQLRVILAYIDENLSRTIALQELAGLFGWSPHYFCRIFKQATGVSPHQYVLRRRIERAKVLLRDHKRELACIALEAGFGSQSHFGAIFRRLTGCTPKRFRQLAAI